MSKAVKSIKTGKPPGNHHSEEAPTQWKKAIIIPIPKKSSKSMSNIRGISLTFYFAMS